MAVGFGDATNAGVVPLATVQRRLVRRFRQFSRAVNQDLEAARLLDEDRQGLRRRYVRAGIALMMLGGLGCIAAAAAVQAYGAWPFFIPAAVVVVGTASLLFAAGTTPLSNEGLRKAARWRGFRAWLKGVARGKETAAPDALASLLPFAVTAGLASGWAKYLERHPGSVPTWFRALSAASQDTAFVAFVAASGATHGGGAGGAGGGAAGGGASGAG